MDRYFVDLGKNSYDIVFSCDYSGLEYELKRINAPKKLMIVTDKNVEKLWLNKLKPLLVDWGYDVCVCVLEPGEENKNIDGVLTICSHCLKNKLDRKSMILALGGGVVGDMAGFGASVYMRGIRFCQLPTTLLSQSDSSVGGKTGVDFMDTKNILGSFFQPALVYINVNTLQTLPEKEFRSGMGEVIKHGIIKDKEFFDFLLNNAGKIKSLDNDLLISMAKTNCAIKAEVVMADEKESGLRKILNFGHTIGHAIESGALFSKTHGECVALGMCAAAYIACRRSYLDKTDLDKIIEIVKLYGFSFDFDIEREKLLYYMQMDKKNVDGKINFILPLKIGDAATFDDVSEEEIFSGIEFLKNL